MKPSDDLKKLYNIYTGKDAQTIQDMCDETGISDSTIRKKVIEWVKAGRWKEVMVKRGNHIVKAYVKVK